MGRKRSRIQRLFEFLGEAIDSVHKYSDQYEAKAKLEVEHFSWFKSFKRSVSSALEHAEFMEDHNSELDKDPELRRLFEETLAEYQASSPKSVRDQRKNIPEASWYSSGIPVEPEVVSDPEVSLWLKRTYANHFLEHQKLVQDVRKRILNSSRLDGFFRDALSERNLTKLYLDFFNQENEIVEEVLARPLSLFSSAQIDVSDNRVNELLRLFEVKAPAGREVAVSLNEESSGFASDLARHLGSLSDRVVVPPIDELERLPTPLEVGEIQVLSLFLDCLEPDWEIYIQPHLNGLRPDFVLLNPSVGIAVFEVKNWNFEAIRYFSKTSSNNERELWARSASKQFSKEHENPFRKIFRYKQEIYDIYCPRLRSKAGFAAITGGVIFPSAPTKDVHALQKEFVIDTENNATATYLPVCGREELIAKDIEKIFPEANRERSNLMTAALADDLRAWLVEPDFSKMQREPLPLDTTQVRQNPPKFA